VEKCRSPEVKVTKIILTKVVDFCQLASHKCGSSSDLKFPSTIVQLRGGWMELDYLSNFPYSNLCFLPSFYVY
jgi:hypothetical protein